MGHVDHVHEIQRYHHRLLRVSYCVTHSPSFGRESKLNLVTIIRLLRRTLFLGLEVPEQQAIDGRTGQVRCGWSFSLSQWRTTALTGRPRHARTNKPLDGRAARSLCRQVPLTLAISLYQHGTRTYVRAKVSRGGMCMQ